jgi:hypothetical protein
MLHMQGWPTTVPTHIPFLHWPFHFKATLRTRRQVIHLTFFSYQNQSIGRLKEDRTTTS